MSRPAPGTATRQGLLTATGVWDRVAAEGGTTVLARGPQLADHLGPPLRYVIAPDGTVLASLPGQPPRPLDAGVIDAAWRTTANGMAGQSTPTRGKLTEAAELLRARAAAEGRRRREEAAAAATARESSERIDAASHAAAAAARRAALQRELAQLDGASPIDISRRAWWRGSTASTP